MRDEEVVIKGGEYSKALSGLSGVLIRI
ncbi:hypothetical protein [Streptococcus acidominimus]|nr:hypothetical protein [Streptococcus acidominimus]